MEKATGVESPAAFLFRDAAKHLTKPNSLKARSLQQNEKAPEGGAFSDDCRWCTGHHRSPVVGGRLRQETYLSECASRL